MVTNLMFFFRLLKNFFALKCIFVFFNLNLKNLPGPVKKKVKIKNAKNYLGLLYLVQYTGIVVSIVL